MIKAIGSVLGGIFGTKKAVDNLLDKDDGLLVKFGGWVDDFNYTDAEKAESDKEKREFGIRQLEALSPFKVVQRILAFSATFLWLLLGVNIIVGIWIESLNPDIFQQVNNTKVLVESGIHVIAPLIKFAVSDYVLYPTLACYSLYFGGGVIDSVKRKK